MHALAHIHMNDVNIRNFSETAMESRISTTHTFFMLGQKFPDENDRGATWHLIIRLMFAWKLDAVRGDFFFFFVDAGTWNTLAGFHSAEQKKKTRTPKVIEIALFAEWHLDQIQEN